MRQFIMSVENASTGLISQKLSRPERRLNCMKLAAAAAMALAALPAVTQAASDVWNVNADGSWATGTNWLSLSAPGATSGTTNTDVATFGAIINAARAITVDANRNIGGINFNANSSAYTLSGGNILLTNGSIIQTSGAGSAHTDVINTSIQIQGDGGSANFTAGSSTATRLLSIGGGVTGVSTGSNVTTLTLGGANTGANTVGGVIGDGAGGGKLALVKSGAGQWNVTNTANSFTGGISLGGGSINWGGDSRALNGNDVTFTANTTMQGFLNSASPNNVMTGKITINAGVTATIGIPSAAWGFSSSGVLAGGNTSVVAASGASASGVVLNFTNSANTFTGQFLNPTGVTTTGGFNVGSLADSAGAGKISMGSGTFTLSGSAPVTLNNRVFELLGTTTGAGLSNNSASAANTLIVNTNLLITGVGAKTFTLGGSNTGANEWSTAIANGSGSTITVAKIGAGTWVLSNASNSYGGGTNLAAGTLEFASGSLGTSGNITFTGSSTLRWATGNTQNISSRLVMGNTFTSTLDTNGNNVNFASAIGSSTTGLLVKAGTGTLTLGGANTFTGATTVNAGTLALTNNLALQFSALTFSAASQLDLSGAATPTIGGLNSSVNLTSVTGYNSAVTALTLQPGTGVTSTYSGIISNGAATNLTVTKSGVGTQTLSGNNTFTGGLAVNAGILALSGTQSFTGGITLSGGNLGSNSAGAGTSNASLNGNTITASTGTSVFAIANGQTITSAIVVSPGATLNIGSTQNAGAAVTVSGPITGSGTLDAGSNSLNQAITTTLTNAGGFSGNVQFSNNQGAGSQTLNVNSIGDSGLVTTTAANVNTSTFALDASATADLTFNTRQFQMLGSTGNTLAIGNNSAKAFTINTNLDTSSATVTKTLTLTGTGTNTNAFNGTITNGGLTTLNLTKTGANATWALTNANTFIGKTTISAGTLSINSIQNASSTTGNSLGLPGVGANSIIDIANTGTLRYTGTGNSSNRVINMTTTNGSTVTLDASGPSGTFALTGGVTTLGTSSTSTLVFTGTGLGSESGSIVNGTGTNVTAITKTNIGSWTLSGANTNTGATNISGGGSLVLDYSSQNNAKIAPGGVLTLGAANSGVGIGGGTLTLSGGSFAQNVASTTLAAGGTFITRSGGTSTLNLGVITVGAGSNRGGSLSFSADNIATTSSTNTNGILGGYAVVGNDWAVNSTNAANGPIIALTSYTALPASGSVTTTNYSLTGSLNLSGAAAVNSLKIIANANGQTLALGNNNTLTPSVISNSNGILFTAGGNGYTYNVTGTGTSTFRPGGSTNSDMFFFINDGTLNITASANTGSGMVVKAGNGTLILGGSSAYSGITMVNQGVLRMTNASGAGTGTGSTGLINVQNGAALELDNNITVGNKNMILTGSGISNGGALRNITSNISNNATTYQGPITIGTGGARINSDAGGSLTLTGGVVTSQFNDVTFGGAGNTTVSTAAISGVGGLVKDGAGILSVTSTNTYTGATTVSAGKLTVASTGNINTTSGVTINGGEFNYNNTTTALSKPVTFTGTGGTLSGTGTITPAVNVTSGNTLSPGNSIGTLTLSGGLTIASGATYNVESSFTDANTGSTDKTVVTGAVNVTGATLNVTDIGSYSGTANTVTLVIIQNDGIDAVTGTFGSILANNNPALVQFSINYAYNGDGGAVGNDVALTFTSVPEPTSLTLLGLGGMGLLARRRRRSSLAEAAV